MTLVVPGTLGTRTAGPAHQAAPGKRPTALPAWPLAGILAFYPLWWALGLGVLIFPLAAVPMLVLLLRRRAAGRPLLLPPGFAWWLLFLAAFPPIAISITAWQSAVLAP